MRPTTRLVLLGALLAPALASAQPSPGDPDAASPTLSPPTAPPQPLPPSPPPPPVAPDSSEPAAAPTVIINPAPAPLPPPTTYVPADAPQYEEVTDTYNAAMFTTGALVFAASYGASVIVAATNDGRGNNRLYVPVAGPWLALNDRGSCDVTKSSCDHETTAKVLLIADGVFQAAGLIGMLDGVLQPSTHRVIRTAKLDTRPHVTPTIVAGDPGVSVFGRF